MRGGSSKGLYFRKEDLPSDQALRDRVLVAAMGSDARQIDGAGGAHPLTSKVAIVNRSASTDADIDYLFVQVVVGEGRVDTTPNCGNILAGVAPFAIEQGLVPARDGRGEGVSGIDVTVIDKSSALARAKARGVPVTGDTVEICGTRIRLVSEA